MDERPERPESDDFSDWTRAELEEYYLELEELTDDQDRFLNRVSPVLSLCLWALETPVEDIPERNLKAALNISRRRNKKLKERVETLETELKDAKKKALAKSVDARLRELEQVREIVRLKQHHRCERLKEENAQLRRDLHYERTREEIDQMQADRLARAVADAYQDGERWETGKDLVGWLHVWAEEHARDMPHSESTIERRLKGADLWARSGRRGEITVDETVSRCIEHAERLSS